MALRMDSRIAVETSGASWWEWDWLMRASVPKVPEAVESVFAAVSRQIRVVGQRQVCLRYREYRCAALPCPTRVSLRNHDKHRLHSLSRGRRRDRRVEVAVVLSPEDRERDDADAD